MALITAAQARVYLQGLTGAGEDTEIDILITRAGGWIAQWLGYEPADAGGEATIESDIYTEFMTGPGGRRLRLPTYPIISVTSIEDDPQEVFDGTTELVPASDYVLRNNEGIVLLKVNATHTWSRTRTNEVIKAIWVAGYTTIPTPIQDACAKLVAFWVKQRSTFGQERLIIDGAESEPKDTETVPDAVKELLLPYKILNGVVP